MSVINKISTEELPKGYNRGKQCIDWNKTPGSKCSFVYEDIQGVLKILEYNKELREVTVEYKGLSVKIYCGHLLKCRIGKLVGKRTNKFKLEVGQVLKDERRDLTITKKFLKHNSTSNSNFKKYQYKCNICGFDCGYHYKKGQLEKEMFVQECHLITNSVSCACCSGTVTVVGVNDIPTTAPTLLRFFIGGYEEAKKYSKGSTKKLKFKCPYCNTISSSFVAIGNLSKIGALSCRCRDGISKPNKFIINLLEQLEKTKSISNVQFEYSPLWANRKRYDSYFEIGLDKYIIEMDGGFHYKDSNILKQSVKKIRRNDLKKSILAQENSITLLRVNCNYGNKDPFTYIKNSIENHIAIPNIIDLSLIKWDCVEVAMESSLSKKVCNIKRNNPDLTVTQISNIVGKDRGVIRNYLKKGNDLNWCNYIPRHYSTGYTYSAE